MSDTMLLAVLRMPIQLWRKSDDWFRDEEQRHSRYLEAADRIESDAKLISTLQTEKERLKGEVDRLTHLEEAVNEWFRQRMYQKNNPDKCTKLFNDVTDSHLFEIIKDSYPTQEPSDE